MKYSSSESSHQDESNGGKIAFVGGIDDERAIKQNVNNAVS